MSQTRLEGQCDQRQAGGELLSLGCWARQGCCTSGLGQEVFHLQSGEMHEAPTAV